MSARKAARLVGLDFGAGVLRAAEVTRPVKGRPTLHRYHEVPLPADAVREGVVVDQAAVASALRDLWSRADFKTKRVLLGMGSQQVLIRELLVPAMPVEVIRETLPFRVQDLLPLPVEEAVLDFYPIAEVEVEDEGTPQLRGLLVAAMREAVVANVTAVQEAGLEVADVDLIPFAVSRLLLDRDETGTEMLLHIGATSTAMVVATGGIPQLVRVVPSGGADVTSAIADRLALQVAQAEEAKRALGLVDRGADPRATEIVRVVADVVGEQIRAIRSTISFYSNQHDGARVDRIVLSGGAAQLPGFARALADAVDVQVIAGHAADRFAVGSDLDEASFLAAGPSPAVALGLTYGSAA